MKRMALGLAWAFVGSTVAFQPLVFHARAAQEQPALQIPPPSPSTTCSAISPRNGCATIPILPREHGISPAKSRTGWNVH